MTDDTREETANANESTAARPADEEASTPREAHDRVAPEVRKLRHGDDVEQRDAPPPDA